MLSFVIPFLFATIGHFAGVASTATVIATTSTAILGTLSNVAFGISGDGLSDVIQKGVSFISDKKSLCQASKRVLKEFENAPDLELILEIINELNESDKSIRLTDKKAIRKLVDRLFEEFSTSAITENAITETLERSQAFRNASFTQQEAIKESINTIKEHFWLYCFESASTETKKAVHCLEAVVSCYLNKYFGDNAINRKMNFGDASAERLSPKLATLAAICPTCGSHTIVYDKSEKIILCKNCNTKHFLVNQSNPESIEKVAKYFNKLSDQLAEHDKKNSEEHARLEAIEQDTNDKVTELYDKIIGPIVPEDYEIIITPDPVQPPPDPPVPPPRLLPILIASVLALAIVAIGALFSTSLLSERTISGDGVSVRVDNSDFDALEKLSLELSASEIAEGTTSYKVVANILAKENVEDFKIYDLHLKRGGDEVQPSADSDGVQVTIEIPDSFDKIHNSAVLHVLSDNSYEWLDSTVDATGGTVTFTTSSFSFFVIVEKPYTVSFNGAKTQHAWWGEFLEPPAIPSKEGYTKGGWSLEGGAVWNFDTSYVTSNLSFTPSYTPNNYTVTYVFGDSTKTQTVTYDEHTTLLRPSRTGYTLSSWVDADGNEVTDGKWTTAGDVTLYADWSANSYVITYMDGDTVLKTQTVIYGEYTTLYTPSKMGYTFSQWLDAEDNMVNDGTWTVANDVALTANWSANNYTVTYVFEDSTKTQTVTYDEHTTLLRPSRTGYTLSPWVDTDGNEVTDGRWTTASDVTLYADWEPVTYTVHYDPNGGTGSSPDTEHIYDLSAALGESSLTRVGYTHSGWNTKPDGSGTDYTVGEAIINLTIADGDTVTLYAQWSANSYTVTYDLNESSIKTTPSISNASDSVSFGANYTLPIPSSDYYKFVGWFTEDDRQLTDDKGKAFDNWSITENVSLIAKWENIDEYFGYKYISTTEEFLKIADNLAGNYLLLCDIDFAGIIGWKPFSDFSGNLNGGGHKISNISVETKSFSNEILLGLIGLNTGTVENLILSNCSFKVSPSYKGENLSVYCGSIAAINSGTISNCETVDTSVVANSSNIAEIFEAQTGRDIKSLVVSQYDSDWLAWVTQKYGTPSLNWNEFTKLSVLSGGIVGLNKGIISDCKFSGTVESNLYHMRVYANGASSEYEQACYAGGIAAYNEKNGSINRVSATGTVNAWCELANRGTDNLGWIAEAYPNAKVYSGGIAGYSENSSITLNGAVSINGAAEIRHKVSKFSGGYKDCQTAYITVSFNDTYNA